MYVVCYHKERYEMHMKVDDSHWQTKEWLIAESNKLEYVLKRLEDRTLIDELYNRIYLWEEGAVAERIIMELRTDTRHNDI